MNPETLIENFVIHLLSNNLPYSTVKELYWNNLRRNINTKTLLGEEWICLFAYSENNYGTLADLSNIEYLINTFEDRIDVDLNYSMFCLNILSRYGVDLWVRSKENNKELLAILAKLKQNDILDEDTYLETIQNTIEEAMQNFGIETFEEEMNDIHSLFENLYYDKEKLLYMFEKEKIGDDVFSEESGSIIIDFGNLLNHIEEDILNAATMFYYKILRKETIEPQTKDSPTIIRAIEKANQIISVMY